MDNERKITKKHIIIGIVSIVLLIAILIFAITACSNGDSNRESDIQEVITTTSVDTTETTTTSETETTTTTTTKVTTTTTKETTTTETSTTEETTTTKKTETPVLDSPIIDNPVVEETIIQTKAPVQETKPKTTTTTTKKVETDPVVTTTTTKAPVNSCNHYYGEISSTGNCCQGWSLIHGTWRYTVEYGDWWFSPGFTGSNAASWVESTGYMKPSYIPESDENVVITASVWLN